MVEAGIFVEAKKIGKSYGEIRAVDGISFSIKQGEIFALLGPNGAGKTTTIKVLSTLVKPDSGGARVGGLEVIKDSIEVRRISGTVPQEIALYDDLNASQHLEFFGRAYGLSGSEIEAREVELLEITGLEDRRTDKTSTYSGGMKRRLNIACALMHKPSFVMMDEPTVGVDPQARERIFDMVRSLRDEGIAILYTTHYMEEAELLSDRIAIMDNGKIIAEGALQEIMSIAGNEDLLELEVEGSVEHLHEDIKDVPGVMDVKGEYPVVVVCNDAGEILPRVISVITAAGLSVKRIDIKSPSLEDVFIKLTGRSLRE
jgi:ABC-2 type transport system ATP-binding protein